MEEIWKDVKPFSYPQKGINGYYNYGYSPKRRTRYYKLRKRKVYRQIRKYGFDVTECWNLYNTIMRWLSDNVGGFFRECGDENDWDANLNSSNYMVVIELCKERQYSYQQHLKEYLESLTGDNYHQFLDFVIPRLVYFEKHFVGYPAKFNSDEEWNKILKEMVQGMCQNDYKLFVENFFYLWD
jgi:hypothetical protein